MNLRKKVLSWVLAGAMVVTALPTNLTITKTQAAETQTETKLAWNQSGLETYVKDNYSSGSNAATVSAVTTNEATITYQIQSGTYLSSCATSYLEIVDETDLRKELKIPETDSNGDPNSIRPSFSYQWYVVVGGKKYLVSESAGFDLDEKGLSKNQTVTYECDIALKYVYDSDSKYYYISDTKNPYKAKITYQVTYTGETEESEGIYSDGFVWNNATNSTSSSTLETRYAKNNVVTSGGAAEVTIDWTESYWNSSLYGTYSSSYYTIDVAKLRDVYGIPEDVTDNKITKPSISKCRWYIIVDGQSYCISSGGSYNYSLGIKLLNNSADTIRYRFEAELSKTIKYSKSKDGTTSKTITKPVIMTADYALTYTGITAADVASGKVKLSDYLDNNSFTEADETVTMPTTSGAVYPEDFYLSTNKNATLLCTYTATFADDTTKAVYNYDGSYFRNSRYALQKYIDGKEVKSYSLAVDVMYGSIKLTSFKKLYTMTVDSSLKALSQYYDGIEDLADKTYIFTDYKDTKEFGEDIEVDTNSVDTDSTDVEFDYVWTAYDKNGNKAVIEKKEGVTYLYSKYYPLVQKFTLTDGTQVSNQVSYYELTVTPKFGGITLDPVVAKYTVKYNPITARPIGYASMVDDEHAIVSARNGEKLYIGVNAYSDENIGEITYAWSTIKDGTTSAIPGADLDSYYTKIADFTMQYRVDISATNLNEFLEKVHAEDGYENVTVDPLALTFTPQETDGYRVTEVSDRTQYVKLGESAKFYVKTKADPDYTVVYQWQKASYDATKQIVYTNIEGATSDTYEIAATKEEDYDSVKVSAYKDITHRLVISLKKDDKTVEKETIDFTLNKYVPSPYTLVESDLSAINSDTVDGLYYRNDFSSYYDSSETVVKGDDYSLSLQTKLNDTSYKETKTWYKMIGAPVEMILKKDDKGAYVQDETTKEYVYQNANATATAPTSYDKTIELVNRASVNVTNPDTKKKYYYKKTVIYLQKVTASTDGATITISGKDDQGNLLDTRGTYFCNWAVNHTLEGLETPVVDEDDWYYVNIVYDSYLKAHAKTSSFEKEVGDAVTLEVVAANKYGESIYPISYQWSKYDTSKETGVNDGYVKLEGKTEAKLGFEALTKDDFGSYKVTVTDTAGNTKVVYFHINRTSATPVFYTPAKQYYTSAVGDEVEFAIEAMLPEKVTDLSYTWWKNEEYIDTDDFSKNIAKWQILNADENKYTAKIASENDQVTYRCDVIYRVDGSDYQEKTFYFLVRNVSSILLERTSAYETYAKLGSTVTFGTRVLPLQGDIDTTKITYQWYDADGDEIEGATSADCSFTFEKPSQLGKITCKVNYPTLTVPEEIDFYLYKYSDTEITSTDSEILADIGDDVTMGVTVENAVGELSYVWSSGSYGEIYGETDKTLTIANIGENEFDSYTCKIYEGEFLVGTRSFEVSMKSQTEEVITVGCAKGCEDETQTHKVHVITGKKAEFKVTAKSSLGRTLRYQWYYKKKAILNATSDTYVIEKATSNNNGTYACRVFTVDPSDYEEVTFSLTVDSGLEADNGSTLDYAAYETELGKSVTLKANAKVGSSDYKVYYQWYKEGELLFGETSSTLTLSKVKYEDLGYYTCKVTDANYFIDDNAIVLGYYVYVNTGLVCEPSIYRPRENDNGVITMYVDARANAGEKISYQWQKYDSEEEEWVDITSATGSKYVIRKITYASLGSYRVTVSTQGEKSSFDYYVTSWSEDSQDRDYAEQGDTVTLTNKIVNKVTDATYTYTWYATDPTTGEETELSSTTNVAEATAPKVLMPSDEVSATVSARYRYEVVRTVTLKDGEKVQRTDTGDYRLFVFPSVNYVMTLPETSHPFDKTLEVKGYQVTGADEIKITLDAMSQTVHVIDANGKAHMMDGTLNRQLTLKGDKAIFVCINPNDYSDVYNGFQNLDREDYEDANPLAYGYKVSKINNTVTKLGITTKTATYTGKPITVDAASSTGSTGKITYTYYKNRACTVKTSKQDGAKAAGQAPVNVGTYYVKASITSDQYYNAATSNVVSLVIKAATQKVTKMVTKKTMKASKVKTKNQTFKLGGKAAGKLSYKKSSGKKAIKVSKKGVVTVAKGTKKGTYKITVKVTAKAVKNYKKTTIKKKIKITVK